MPVMVAQSLNVIPARMVAKSGWLLTKGIQRSMFFINRQNKHINRILYAASSLENNSSKKNSEILLKISINRVLYFNSNTFNTGLCINGLVREFAYIYSLINYPDKVTA